MKRIPNPDRQFQQTNRSDVLGNIWATFNCDLNANWGRLRLGTRMLKVTDSNSLSGMGRIIGARVFSGGNFITSTVAVGSKVLIGSPGIPGGTFVVDTSTSTPATDPSYSDIEIFNGKLYVSTTTKIVRLDTGTSSWTDVSSTLSSSFPHMFCNYSGVGRLYFTTNATQIFSMSTGESVATSGSNTLDLISNTSNLIVWMRAGTNRIWIGTINQHGGQASIYEWDGVKTQPNREYKIESTGSYACVIKDDVPYVMDSDGRLLVFTGSAFKEVARLPYGAMILHYRDYSLNGRAIHPNGMCLTNGRINVLVQSESNFSDQPVPENFPSGIWEYREESGLYHKHPLSYYAFSSGTNTDYGQARISTPGCLQEIVYPFNSSTNPGRLLAGATYYTNTSSTADGLFVDDPSDTIQKKGYFITAKLNADQVSENFQKAFTRVRPFLSATDKLIVKYRLSEAAPLEVTGTWVNSTTLTTTTSLSSYAVGDEVEILNGQGAGQCGHIIALNPGSGSTIVVLDETISGVTATNTCKARFQKWIKIPTVIDAQNIPFKELPISKGNTWIQLKVYMTFTGAGEFEEMDIFTNPDQRII